MTWENEEYEPNMPYVPKNTAAPQNKPADPKKPSNTTRHPTRKSRARNLASLSAVAKNWGENKNLPPEVMHKIEKMILGVRGKNGPPRPLQYTLRKQKLLKELEEGGSGLVNRFKLNALRRKVNAKEKLRKKLRENVAKAERGLLKQRLGFGSRSARSASRTGSSSRRATRSSR